MSNLVVVRDHLDIDGAEIAAMLAGLPVEEVVARHPSRLIVIEHEADARVPARRFAAAVGIVVFVRRTRATVSRKSSCEAACAEASLHRSFAATSAAICRPASGGPRMSERPPLEAFVAIGRQLVYDSRAWRDVRAAIRALAPLVAEPRIDLADVKTGVAWRRCARHSATRRAPTGLCRHRGANRASRRGRGAGLACSPAGYSYGKRTAAGRS